MAPEGSWPAPPLQDCLNCPWRQMHFSAGYKGTWIFSCLKASQMNLSLPARSLLDAAVINLLWSQLHQSVPMPSDTGESITGHDTEDCVGLPVSEMVGAKISFSLSSSVSCVSSHSKAGSSSHSWIQIGKEGAHLDAAGCMRECSTSLLLVSVPLVGVPFNVGATLFVIFTCKGELWSLIFWNQIQLATCWIFLAPVLWSDKLMCLVSASEWNRWSET